MTDPQTGIELKDLRPVEAYLLMNPRRYDLDECFRLILVDLILRGVLGYREEVRRVSAASAPAKFYMIYQGPNFTDSNLLHYERFFLKPLTKAGDNQALWIRPYGQEFIQNVLGSRRQLPLDIILSTAINSWIRYHWSNWLTGWLQLNKPGKQVAEVMQRRLRQEVSDLVPDHKYKQLTSLGPGFILLSVEKYRPEWFKEEVVIQFLKNTYQLDASTSNTVSKLLLNYPLATYFYEEDKEPSVDFTWDTDDYIDWP